MKSRNRILAYCCLIVQTAVISISVSAADGKIVTLTNVDMTNTNNRVCIFNNNLVDTANRGPSQALMQTATIEKSVILATTLTPVAVRSS